MKLASRASWFSPALVRGGAFTVAGLVVLVAPDVSAVVLRYVIAGFLVVSGVSVLWARLRHKDGAHGLWRAGVALAAGVGLTLVPIKTIHLVELILAAYLVIQGLLALYHSFERRKKGEPSGFEFRRGMILLSLAALLWLLPGEMFELTVAATAVAAVFVGLVMVAWSARHGSEKPGIASRALAAEVIWNWLSDQDVGNERREGIADALYFEVPHRGAKLTSYLTMLLLSTALASLAILQDSTAVVIGAMLVAPLMTPIMGCAAGLVAGWRNRVLHSLGAVATSAVAAIGLAWILAAWVPALVPLEINTQVLSRVSPTLLDMAVALVAGAAGAYATLDDRVSSSLTGVAIAVALVPPLGVVGISLQAGLWAEATGAFLLFATNLVSIILASCLVFVLVGFAPVKRGEKHGLTNADVVGSVAIVALLIMVPLGLTGHNVLSSISRSGAAQAQVVEWLGPDSSLRLNRVRTTGEHVEVLLTGSGDVPDVAALETALTARFGLPVQVRVELFPSVVVTAASQAGGAEAEAR